MDSKCGISIVYYCRSNWWSECVTKWESIMGLFQSWAIDELNRIRVVWTLLFTSFVLLSLFRWHRSSNARSDLSVTLSSDKWCHVLNKRKWTKQKSNYNSKRRNVDDVQLQWKNININVMHIARRLQHINVECGL